MVHYLAGQLSSALGITGGQKVVKPAAGKLLTVSVVVAGTVAIYDSAATGGGNTAANQIAAFTTVGVFKVDFPFLTGLVVDPGAGTVAVSYE